VSVLGVGLSHNSAPVTLLERAALDGDQVTKLLADLMSSESVAEAMVLATCNRVEVYADVSRFHAGVQQVTEALCARCDLTTAELTDHLYVHYEDKAVQHLFSVAAGLDSMVVGEQQVLGQLRTALADGRSEQSVSRVLGPLTERALRVGKRVQSETGIGAAGRSLVSVGVDVAADALGGLAGRPVAVLGAGSISSLAVQTLQRSGVGEIVVLNRTAAKAQRLAATVGGRSVAVDELPTVLSEVDLLVSCTGATAAVITADDVIPAVAARAGRPLVLLDLALPRDVDAAVRTVSGVTVVGLDDLSSALAGEQVAAEVEAARRMVAEEVGLWLARQRADRVSPTVAALRARARQVVDAEVTRLLGRLPDLDERAVAEVRQGMNRAVDKLLHAPTVRIKELAEAAGADTYAEALRDLFALDPQTPEAVTRASISVEPGEQEA
jgi:glutamyl-tRNA reductase